MHFNGPDNANGQRRYLAMHAVRFRSDYWIDSTFSKSIKAMVIYGKLKLVDYFFFS